jgi:hypothetical protein
MIITWMNRKDITSAQDFKDVYAGIKKGATVSIKAVLPNGARFIAFTKE